MSNATLEKIAAGNAEVTIGRNRLFRYLHNEGAKVGKDASGNLCAAFGGQELHLHGGSVTLPKDPKSERISAFTRSVLGVSAAAAAPPETAVGFNGLVPSSPVLAR